jgi:hypothetical protein
VRQRHDGFTPAKQKRFFAVLGKTGCISDAAKSARISTTTVDRWRRRNGRFDKLCDLALERASSKIELLAWERAVTGIEEPVYLYGKFSHMRVKRSDAIFRMLLMASNPRKYGRMGAAGQQRKAPKKASEAELEEALLKNLDVLGRRIEAEEAKGEAWEEDSWCGEDGDGDGAE